MKDKQTIIFSSLIIIILIIFITIMIIVPKSKYYKNEGFSIKLPSNFNIKKSSTLDTYLYSKEIKIGVKKEEFKKIEDKVINNKSSLQEYASRVAELNNFNVSELYKIKNTDYIYYSYYKNDYIYITLFAKTDDAFYSVYFVDDKEKKEELFESFKKWSKTVKFSK